MSHGRESPNWDETEKAGGQERKWGIPEGKKGAWERVRDITPLLRSVGPRWTAGPGDVRFPILAEVEGSQ